MHIKHTAAGISRVYRRIRLHQAQRRTFNGQLTSCRRQHARRHRGSKRSKRITNDHYALTGTQLIALSQSGRR